ncbi:hypothetical protein [Cognatiluteimonas lumbrici]|uniref:hypothetical protein n=1 Tax=Cognatiluteimonas lumbrici TaxID=2559601 RepID=UPI00112DFCD6|nr:hypothetical protein [Luteimonas lumbrici]
MNKKILLPTLLAIALAGCGNDSANQASTDAAASPASVATEQAPAAPCVDNAFYSPMPDASLRFDFPFRIARDRVYADDNGTPRRGLSLEYLEGNADEVWSSVSNTMLNAGYEQADAPSALPYSGTFTKQDQPAIFVKVATDPVKNPTGDDVKGSVWLSWVVGDAPSAP